MRFRLTLYTTQQQQRITLNYQYPLSAAIYKIIHRADDAYASFLHDHGYGTSGKPFKLFTFSDLSTPFDIKDDRLVMRTNNAELSICFHVPDAAGNFIKGLFMHQQIDIADSRDKAVFTVQQVITETHPIITGNAVLLQPMSPVVVGRKNERGNYDYAGPDAADFGSLIAGNLIDKYASVNECSDNELKQLKKDVLITPMLFKQAPRRRLLTIKAGTPEQTQVRGFDKFRIRLQAPADLITIALNAGIGMHNAMGMGCVEVVGN